MRTLLARGRREWSWPTADSTSRCLPRGARALAIAGSWRSTATRWTRCSRRMRRSSSIPATRTPVSTCCRRPARPRGPGRHGRGGGRRACGCCSKAVPCEGPTNAPGLPMAIGRGIVVGFVGTATMTAFQKLVKMPLTGRNASFVPAKMGARVLRVRPKDHRGSVRSTTPRTSGSGSRGAGAQRSRSSWAARADPRRGRLRPGLELRSRRARRPRDRQAAVEVVAARPRRRRRREDASRRDRECGSRPPGARRNSDRVQVLSRPASAAAGPSSSARTS